MQTKNKHFVLFHSWKVSELIINGLQRKDDGLYECQARNEGGQFFKSGHIQVSMPTFSSRTSLDKFNNVSVTDDIVQK